MYVIYFSSCSPVENKLMLESNWPSKEPGEDISQSGHELHSKNRGKEKLKISWQAFFVMNWLQIPSCDSWGLSSFIHMWFSCKYMFFYLGARLQFNTWIFQKEKKWPRNTCLCLKAWTGPQADTSETFSHLWWRTSRLCQPEWCPSFRTMLDGGPHPRNGKYSVCWQLLYWQLMMPSFWSNTSFRNALCAN